MAGFPPLRPSTRRYGFGLFPLSIESTLGGDSVRFIHGTNRLAIQLELGYEVISEAEAQQLRDHFRGQEGGHRSFLLPSVIWAGHSNPANIVPIGTNWVYASQPEETHRSGRLFDVAVQLAAVI
jgi:hypothetical protein